MLLFLNALFHHPVSPVNSLFLHNILSEPDSGKYFSENQNHPVRQNPFRHPAISRTALIQAGTDFCMLIIHLSFYKDTEEKT